MLPPRLEELRSQLSKKTTRTASETELLTELGTLNDLVKHPQPLRKSINETRETFTVQSFGGGGACKCCGR
jgi:hypothetical protein